MCLSLRVQRLRELPLKMPERLLDLFPNDKIVNKTLIAIEQIFAVHYEQRVKGGGRGWGGGGKRRMLRRASLARRGSLRFSMLA